MESDDFIEILRDILNKKINRIDDLKEEIEEKENSVVERKTQVYKRLWIIIVFLIFLCLFIYLYTVKNVNPGRKIK